MVGVVILVVLLFLGFLVFVPLMIYLARRGAKNASSFVPDLLRKTGLTQNGNTLTGQYGGYPVEAVFGLGFNYGKLALSSGSAWQMFDKLEGRNTFYQTLHIQMRVPGANMPGVMIKEHTGLLRTDQWIMDKVEGRNVELPEVDGVKIGKARVYSADPDFARRLASDAQLQQLVGNWYFTDIRAQGDMIEFVLNDNMVMPTFGSSRMSRPDFVVEALDMCVRVAETAKN